MPSSHRRPLGLSVSFRHGLLEMDRLIWARNEELQWLAVTTKPQGTLIPSNKSLGSYGPNNLTLVMQVAWWLPIGTHIRFPSTVSPPPFLVSTLDPQCSKKSLAWFRLFLSPIVVTLQISSIFLNCSFRKPAPHPSRI